MANVLRHLCPISHFHFSIFSLYIILTRRISALYCDTLAKKQGVLMAVNKKINKALLEYAIKSNYKTVAEFAKEKKFKQNLVYNWIYGKTSPSDHQRKRLCRALNIPEDKILLSSLASSFRGLENALFRWSEEHRNLERESLPDHVAVNVLLSLRTTAEQEAIEDESVEAPFFVQGPDESSDTSEQ